MRKRAFITGIAGQDGSYLSEYLISKNYEVLGLIRRNSAPENQSSRIDHLIDGNKLNTEYGDMCDKSSLDRIIKEFQPDEIYNLAAQSHVRVSIDLPIFTVNVNSLGVINLLESFRQHAPKSKFYQASSSEMFGNNIDNDKFQRETTQMDPTSPYGCAKLFAYKFTRHYRNAYNLFISNGILFNHESPRRGTNFVTNKVIKSAVLIYLGKLKILELGNLDSSRDWGHSKDYTRAMNMILNHDKPDDFIISSGQSYSVRDLCSYVFKKLGMDYKNYIVQNPKYMRTEELEYLRGDCSKAKKILGWEPEYNFYQLLDEMIDYWLNNLK